MGQQQQRRLAVGLARVSKAEQAQGWSLLTQHTDNRTYANELGYEIVKEFEDVITGAKTDRQGLAAAVEYIGQNGIEALFVWKIDRLYRNTAGFSNVRQRLQSQKVEIYLSQPRRPLARKGPERLLDNMEANFAEYFRNELIEKVVLNIQSKVAKGKVVGGGMAPYGYRYEGQRQNRYLVPDECDDKVPGSGTANIVRLIYQWYVYDNLGVREIAKRLEALGTPTPPTSGNGVRRFDSGRWSIPTLYRIIKRPTNKGKWEALRTERIEVRDGTRRNAPRPESERRWLDIPPIVDEVLWDEAQKKLSKGRQLARRNSKREYLLGRLLRCQCGYAYSGYATVEYHRDWRTRKKLSNEPRNERRYYRCGASSGQGKQTVCRIKPCRAEVVEGVVWQWVESNLLIAKWVEELMRSAQRKGLDQHREVQDELNQLLKRREEVHTDYQALITMGAKLGARGVAIVVKQSQQYEEQLNTLDNLIADKQREAKRVYTDQEIDHTVGRIRAFEQYRAGLAQLAFDEKRELLEALVVSGTVMEKDGRPVVRVKGLLEVYSEPLPLDGELLFNSVDEPLGSANAIKPQAGQVGRCLPSNRRCCTGVAHCGQKLVIGAR